MGVSRGFALSAIMLTAGFAYGQAPSDPDIGPVQNPLPVLVLADEKNRLACYENDSGFSCAPYKGDGPQTLTHAGNVTHKDKILVQIFESKASGTVCYTNSAGLWCGQEGQGKGGDTPPYTITLQPLGAMGMSYVIHDHARQLVLHTNSANISAATPADFMPALESETVDFNRAAMQRIRNYKSGTVCYLAPAATKNFACATLREDTTSQSDIRQILNINDPILHYSVVDVGSNRIIINAGSSGVCATLPNSPQGAADPRIEIRQVPTLTGQELNRYTDELLGVISYANKKGLSCHPLLALPASLPK